MYTISSGGCNAHHPAPFTMNRPNGISEYLLLFVHTKSLFVIGEKQFEMLPDQMILIDKNTPYQYTAMEHAYVDDWIHFNCADSEAPASFSRMLNTPLRLRNASRVSSYMQQALWEFSYASCEHRNENIHMLMKILINHLTEAVAYQSQGLEYSPYQERLQEIRMELSANPNRDIYLEEICASLSISPSYFQHLYTQLFGVSFRNDIIHMRISYAKQLLLGTDYGTNQIALLCGYHNEVHFYRQFKRIVGVTPNVFRKNNAGVPE